MILRRAIGSATLLFAMLFASEAAFGQYQCNSNAVSPTTVRAEGNTELLPSFSFTCTSATGTAGTLNLLFQTANTPITSKVLNTALDATEITATVGSQTTQGTVVGNVAEFSNLTLYGTSVTITVTNVRVNVSGLSNSGFPPAVTMQAVFQGITNVTTSETSVETLAYALPSLGSPAGSTTSYSGCFSVNGGTAPSFLVPVNANFAGAFRTLADEAGPPVTVNGISNTPNSGTRFRILFSNVPGGIQVPATLTGVPGIFVAQLSATEAGAFLPYSVGSSGLATLTVSNGAAEAVYEVTGESLSTAGLFAVPVYLTGTPAQLAAGTVTATVGLAPGSATSNIPRFSQTEGTETVTGIPSTSCTLQSIGPTTLSQPVLNYAYSQWLSAGAAKTWSISSGALPPGLTLNASYGVISGTPTSAGTYTFTVQVTDYSGNVFSKNCTLQVAAATSVTTTSLPGATLGTAYSQTLTATGGLGSYTWGVTAGSLPAGLTLNSSTGAITGTPYAGGGTTTFTVNVLDSSGQQASQALSISVATPPAYCYSLGPINTATAKSIRSSGLEELLPVLSLSCAGTGGATTIQISLAGIATPSQGVTVPYPGLPITSKVLNSASGVTEAIAATTTGSVQGLIDSTGTIMTFAGVTVPAGNSTVNIGNLRVNVSGVTSGAAFPFQVTVSASTTNIVNAVPAAAVAYGYSALNTPTMSKGSAFPSACSVGASNGPAFTVNVSEGFAGAFKVQGGGSNSSLFSVPVDTETGYFLTVGGVNNAATSGTRVAFKFSGVPAGLNIYVPTVLTATQNNGAFPSTVGGTLTLTASESGAFSAVTVVAPTNANTLPSSPALAQVTITNGSGEAVYEVTADDANAIGTFDVPVYVSAPSGTTSSTITASVYVAPVGATGNIPNFASNAATVTVAGLFPFCLTSLTLPQGQVGTAYPTTTIAVSGGTAPYTFSGAVLPAGLTLASSGTITGTPTAVSYNTSNVPVTITDANGLQFSYTLTLTVIPGTLSITTTSLPSGLINTAYTTTTLAAKLGTTPYTWSIMTGSLPTGLTLNASTGVISGTPTVSGSFPLTVKVTDGAISPQTATANFTINIASKLTFTTLFPFVGAVVGTPITPVSFVSGGTPPYTCSLAGGSTGNILLGLTFNPTTCVLSGTPRIAGYSATQLTVSDSGLPAQQATVNYQNWQIDNAVEITNQTLPAPVSGVYTFTAAGGYGGYYNWSVASGSLPAGWTLNSQAGTIAASGPAGSTFALTVQDNQGNFSAPRTFSTTPAMATTTSLSLSAAPSVYGQATRLTASVSPPSAGNVTFFDGTSVLGTGTLVNGQASFSTSLLSQGSHSLRALYVGSQAWSPSVSGTIVRTVGGNAEQGFSPAVSYVTATSPARAVTGDFNGDGKADLAVTGATGIDILLGKGDGTFATSIHTAGATAFSLAAGDFNADGKLDVAFTGQAGYDSTVYVLLGNGDGTFQPTTGFFSQRVYGFNIGAADFNGDGIPDLVVSGISQIVVFSGNGDGSFYAAGSQPIVANVPPSTYGIAIADFNNDGYPDAAVSLYDGSVYVYLGNGDGTLRAAASYGTQSFGQGYGSLAAADFNGDGFTDIATPAGVLLGKGDGTFGTLLAYPSHTGGTPVVADFNGDGKPDLALAGNVVLGNGDGTFGAPTYYSQAQGAALAADFNGDGRPDLAGPSQAITGFAVNLGLAPLSVSCTLPTGTIYTTTGVSFACPATGGTAPYTWSISTGTLPAGVTLNTATGAIAGTPTASGSFTFTVQVTDSSGPLQTATANFTVNIASKLTPTSSFPPTGTVVGTAIAPFALATGGTTPYTCSFYLESGPLPPGISLNATTCVLSGTPTAPGNYYLTGTVTDSSSPAQTASFGGYPNWTINSAVQITNRNLPAPVSGVYTFTATGGYPPYSNWTVSSGALPSGWTLNASTGTIAAPASNTSATFSLTVQDSYGNVSPARSYATATPASTTTTLTLSAAPSTYGQPVTLTAAVTPSAATGNVTFFDGTTILGSVALSSGQAMLSTSLLAQGTRSLKAVYVGSTGYASSSSANQPRTVSSNPASGFQTAASYTTATNPYREVAGDFNGDGKSDLAVSTGTGIDVLLGNGDGTFQTARHTAGLSGYLATGDFNGDGITDLAFANPASQPGVYILLGHGDGTFQPVMGVQAGLALSIAVGDFNGDGIADLAAGLAQGSVSLLLGNGDGSFHPGGIQPVSFSPVGIAIGDFNRDGLADMAVMNSGVATLQIFLGNGDGTLQTGVSYTAPVGVIAAADFNGDGYLDLATAGGVLLGNGDGTFGTLKAYAGSATGSPIVADFNGDGKPDVLVAGSAGLSLLIGNGDGTFASPVAYGTATGFSTTQLNAVADFNGDGRPDFAVANNGGSSVSVYLGLAPLSVSCTLPTGSIYITTALSIPCPATGGTTPYTWSISSGALPGGVTLNTSTGAVTGTPTASGTFSFTVQVTDSSTPVQTAAQPVTLTVTPPLTTSGPPSNSVIGSPIAATILAQGGTAPYNCSVSSGSLPPGISLNASTCVLSGAPTSGGRFAFGLSVSDSGVPPLTATASYTTWLIYDAVEITNTVLPAPVSGVYTLSAAGGYPPYSNWSVASGALPSGWTLNASAGTITAPASNTSATFGLTVQDSTGNVSAVRTFTTVPPTATTTTLSVSSATSTYGQAVTLTAAVSPAAASGKVAFFDGTTILGTGTLTNGSAAIVVPLPSQGAGTLHAYYIGGSGYAASVSSSTARTVKSVAQSGFSAPLGYATAPSPSAVVIGDFNGDGKADLAVSTGSGIDILLGNGDGTFGTAVLSAANSGTIVAGDFNQDGKLDLAQTNFFQPPVDILLGNGDGTLKPAVGYIDGGTTFLAVGDLNGDGIPDIAAMASSGGDLQLGNGDGTFYPGAILNIGANQPATGIAIGDFNGDGIADVAVTLYPSGVDIFPGTGGGSFAGAVSYAGGGGNGSLVVADFNGDGFLDLATGTAVLLGKGDGTFGAAKNYPSSVASSPVAGDFNGDGKIDLLIGTVGGGPVNLLIGNGDGTFAAPVAYTGSYYYLAVADFNGDGRPDIAATTSSGVSILLGLAPLSVTCTLPSSALATNTALSIACPATGGAAPYTWSITSGALPAGVTLNASTGAISGTPTASGSFPVTVMVTDGETTPQTAMANLTLNIAPKLTTTTAFPLGGTVVGTAIVPVSFLSGGTAPYNCSINSTTSPAPGLTLNPTTCVLSGTATVPGLYTFALTASDSGTPAQTVKITYGLWAINSAVSIINRTLPAPVGGVYTFSVWGGYPPYMGWAVSSGALPSGWTLNASAGTITAPTANTSATFSLTVQDSYGHVSPAQSFTTATPAATVTTLTLSAAPSAYGHPVTLTASVTPSTATGSVTFFDGTTDVGSAELSGGQASLITRQLAQGPRSLKAVYVGNAGYLQSSSAAVARTIGSVASLGYSVLNSSSATSTFLSTAVSGDFNGDGVVDLAAPTASGIDILIGNGDGTFQAAIHTAAALGSNLVAQDFNGDGKLDLAYVNQVLFVLPGNGDGTFGTAMAYQAGILPSQIAAGDFNGDGIPDLVLADTPGAVSIVLGKGDGSFYPASTLSVTGIVGKVVVGDFNRDGLPDVAVTAFGITYTVSIYLGNGDGTLQPNAGFSGPAGGAMLAAADFNGDGFLDLSLPNGIFPGKGDGTFGTLISYPVSGYSSLAVADFNGDGKPDVLLSGSASSVLLLGNGDGSFTASTSSPQPTTGAVADFNGDGRVDIAGANSAAPYLRVLLGLAPLSVTCTLPTGAISTATALSIPCPADGGMNPYTWSVGSGALPAGVSLNTSTGAITGTPTATGAFSFAVAVADSSSPVQTASQPVTLTVAPALLTSAPPANSIVASPIPATVLASGGTPPYTCSVSSGSLPPGISLNASTCALSGTPTSGGRFAFGLSVADSGMPPQTAMPSLTWTVANALEITNAALPTPVSGVYTFGAAGGYPPYSNWTVASGALPSGWTLSASAGTITASGTGASSTFSLTVQDSKGNVSAPRTFTTAPLTPTTTTLSVSSGTLIYGHAVTLTATVSPAAATGKVTFFDGTTIVGTGALSSGVATLTTRLLASGPRSLHAYYLGGAGYAPGSSTVTAKTIVSYTQSGFAAAVNDATAGTSGVPVVGDFNGDGVPDLAVPTGAGTDVLLGKGDGTFQAATHNTALPALSGGLVAADFNGDGKLDVAFSTSQSGLVFVALGKGDGTFAAPASFGAGGAGSYLGVGDLNGDGIPDLATAGAVYLGNGDGTFYAGATFALTDSGPGAVAVGDFNGDGVPDLAIAFAKSVGIFIGSGGGAFQAGVSYTAAAGGFVATGDFNIDGFADLAVSSGVLLGKGDGTFGASKPYPSSATGIPSVGDFNGDGKPDVLLGAASYAPLNVLTGNGDGTFSGPTAVSGSYASAATADFSGSGRADIAAATSNGVGILLGSAPAPLSVSCNTTTGPTSTASSWTALCLAVNGTYPFTWTISAGTLPAGLTLNATTGVITGTPTATGAYSFTLTVTDTSIPVQTGSLAFTGTIASPGSGSGGGGGGGGGGGFPTGGSTLTAAPTALSFTAAASTPPPPQTFALTSATPGTTFTTIVSVTSGGNWLSVAPASGATDTQGTLTVSVNPAGLAQGSYSGTITVNSSGAGSATVAVALTVLDQISTSPSALSFSYSVGDPAPAAQGLSIFATPTSVSILALPIQGVGQSWLSVGTASSANSPASVPVSVHPANLAPGIYKAQVSVSSPSSSTAAANPVLVPVTLIVVQASPQLSVSPASANVNVTQGSAAVAGQIVVSNAGGGTLQFQTAASTAQGNWLTLSVSTGSATASSPASVGYTVNAAGLTPGPYMGQIVVNDVNSSAQATVNVMLSVSAASQSIVLSQTGLAFNAISGATNPPAQGFTVSNSGTGAMAWTTASSAAWLTVSPASGSSVGGLAGTPVVVSANPNGLAAGKYYGSVSVTAPGAANSPQTVSVSLNVTTAGQTPATIGFSAGGVLFTGVAGGAATSQKAVNLYNPSASVVNYTANVYTANGGAWLGVTPASGPLAPGNNAITITANAAAVTAGLQTGSVRFSFDNGTGGAIDADFLASGASHALPSTVCPGGSPSFVLPIFLQPVDQSSISAQVAQHVQVQIVDDCGNLVSAANGGSAQVAFGNGDAPLTLTDTGSGVWEGTWLPGTAGASVTLQANASEGSVSSVAGSISVAVQPAASNAPGLVTGVVNAAGAGQSIPSIVAPGSYIAIYGTGLAGNGATGATTIPLPTTLNGTQLLLGNVPMPLLYASATQVNALAPQGLAVNTSAQLVVVRGSTLSVPSAVTVTQYQPAIYTQNLTGSGQGIVEIAGTSLLASPSSAIGQPAVRGTDYLVVFATGLGPVAGPAGQAAPADGAGAPLSTIYRTTSAVTATLGGVSAPVVFAGLTPSLVGLYQVNVQVPAGAPAGSAVALSIGVGGAVSNTVTVALQ